MTRSLAALACFAALLGAPAQSQAGVIPWMYDSIFGYGPYGGGGYGWGAGYRGYTTGYAPFYSGYVASYAPAYGGGACCGTSTSYFAPWTGDVGACCNPCGTPCCNPCGTGCGSACGTGCGVGCDPGCANCPGGNCATGSGTSEVGSTPTKAGPSENRTYDPATNPPDSRNPPQDQFGPARDRGNLGTGTSAPPTGTDSTIPGGSFGTPPSNVGPNDATPFAPREPSGTRSGDPDARRIPRRPAGNDEKIAFKTPARFTRSTLQPVFELPTIVSAPPATRPEVTPAPTAVASK